MHIAYGCFLRWVIPKTMGFNTKRVKIWMIWDTPETSNIDRQIFTSGIQKPPVSVQTKKLSLEESSVRISDVSITGTSSGVKNTVFPLTNCQLWMIGDPLGAPPNHWKKPNKLKPLPLDFLLLICFITFVASIQLQPQGVPVAVSSAVVELGFQQYSTILEL